MYFKYEEGILQKPIWESKSSIGERLAKFISIKATVEKNVDVGVWDDMWLKYFYNLFNCF